MAPQALIIHSDRKTAEAGREVLSSSGYECAIAAGVEEALAFVGAHRPQLCLVGASDSWSASSPTRPSESERPVVAITSFPTLEAAVNTLKSTSVVMAAEQVVHHIKHIVQSLRSSSGPIEEPTAQMFPGIVGVSPVLQTSLKLAQRVSHRTPTCCCMVNRAPVKN